MQLLLVVSALVAVSSAIVCPPNFCDNVKQPLLDCKGGLLKNSGFCGCTHSCAKVEGETCRMQNIFLMGVPNTEVCDEGLTCRAVNLEGNVQSFCVNATKTPEDTILMSKRFVACPKNACDDVEQPALNCAGGILEKVGFCGCTDACAKVEGEECQIQIPLLGLTNSRRCDKDLVCQMRNLEGKTSATCVKASEASKEKLFVSKRSAPHCDTACRRKSLLCTMSMVIYSGQWFAKCDLEGNFLPQQCNNKKECFCVEKLTGTIDESTRVLGSANCFS